jgi:hypothetical protein
MTFMIDTWGRTCWQAAQSPGLIAALIVVLLLGVVWLFKEEDQEAEVDYQPVVQGLINKQNCCYALAAIQMLAGCHPFCRQVLARRHPFAASLSRVLRGQSSNSVQDVLSALRTGALFAPGKQEDCSEFILKLF